MAVCVPSSLRRGLRSWSILLGCIVVTIGPSAIQAQQIDRKRIVLPVRPLRLARIAPAEAEAPEVEPAIPATTVGSDRPVFHLRDAGRIAGDPVLDSLQVETAYGVLSIPTEQLVRVRFARRLDPELEKQIETLIAQLGDDDFDTREAATLALQKIGAPAAGLVRKAVKSDSEEVQSRATSILGVIQVKTPSGGEDGTEDSLPPISGSDDEIVTARMTVRGKIVADAFQVRTKYGELRVVIADLVGIAFQNLSPSQVKADVTAQHQAPGNWVDTKLDLLKGQRFKISATGNITVSNYGIVSGPTGNTDYSGHASFGGFPMLSLVGRVGKKGQPFLVGNGYSGKSKSDGRLYLAVVPFSPYAQGAQGTYQAKINALGSE